MNINKRHGYRISSERKYQAKSPSPVKNGEQNITVDTIGKITAGLKAKARFSIGV